MIIDATDSRLLFTDFYTLFISLPTRPQDLRFGSQQARTAQRCGPHPSPALRTQHRKTQRVAMAPGRGRVGEWTPESLGGIHVLKLHLIYVCNCVYKSSKYSQQK